VTRTRPITIVLFAVFGAAAAWLLEIALSAAGMPIAVPPYTLALALAVIGGLDIVFALPVRRAVRQRESNRIDPFYATRVVLLAKSSSIAGALILSYLLTRTVVAGVGSILMATAATVGAVVLVVCGLVAEYMCSIPPEDGDKGDENPASVRPH
jgi:hypothetical protein